MKKHLSTLVLILFFLVGLSLVLYPTISDYINSLNSSRAIASYVEIVDQLDTDDKQSYRDAALAYNQSLKQRANDYLLTDEQKIEYEQLLNIGGNGVMGYIVIDALDINLPIYHGTGESILQTAVGHLEWTSLPVGGVGSHCVLSGHRGLPSAKLFTNLDQIREGDIFLMRVLDEVLTYEVDQILIVEPHEVEPLRIVPGMDCCTLVTCTPYGVNSHRLMVRGHRIETLEEEKMAAIRVTAEAMQVDTSLVAVVLAVPLLIFLLIYVLVKDSRRNSRRRKKG